MTSMTRIFFLIRALDHGGAERQLIELAKGLDKTRFAVTLATFYDGGALRPEIEGIEGVTVLSLRKKGRWDVMPFLWRLARTVYAAQPQIVHGYMSVANELGILAGMIAGARVVCGLRVSDLDLSRYDWAAAWGFRAGALFSRFADLVVANSRAGERMRRTWGIAEDEFLIGLVGRLDPMKDHPTFLRDA